MNQMFAALISYLPLFGCVFAGVVLLYLFISLVLTYLVQQFPRQPVSDTPDWGSVIDTTIPAVDGRSLEVWRIEPDGKSRGIVIFAHGWGRNRDRMVSRARQFAAWGFTAVIHSARDHGNSSPKKMMNAMKFAEDIEAVMKWVNHPVFLYGHSAGSVGAIIAASRNQSRITALFLEASYADNKEALLSLYYWVSPAFGKLFGRMIIFWMTVFYRGKLDQYSPARLAGQIDFPVMVIHGEKDSRFPLSFAQQLINAFSHEKVGCYFARDAGHSDSSQTRGYGTAVKSFIDEFVPGPEIECRQQI